MPTDPNEAESPTLSHRTLVGGYCDGQGEHSGSTAGFVSKGSLEGVWIEKSRTPQFSDEMASEHFSLQALPGATRMPHPAP